MREQLEAEFASKIKALEDQLSASQQSAARELAAEKARAAQALEAAVAATNQQEINALTNKYNSMERIQGCDPEA